MIELMSPAQYFRPLVGAFLVSSMGLSIAQNPPNKNVAPPAGQAAAPSKDQDKPKEPEKPKNIDEVTKDFTKLDGLVTLYRQYKDKKDTLYMELPESRLEKLMLIQITSASGTGDTSAFVFHGMPISDLPVKFHKIDDDHVQLLLPNLAHRGNTAESELGIKRSFPDTILANFDVVAKQDERHSVLIDVSNFFKSDVDDLSQVVDPFGLDPMGTRIDTVKDFPDNFVVRTVYQLDRRGPASSGDPRAFPWAVSFNISDLPTDDGYQPRIGDPRVGYFTTNFEDLSDASQEFDANVNYIMRWNLQKADPSAAMSEPKKPIVFYIDNAVPKEYRDDVRKGILMYNSAFEKVGIKDAIQVKQMPDDADWDIADLRYNVVRWTTGMPFAIALFRANPITGEILNASVNMDAGFAASGSSQFDNIIDPSVSHIAMPDQSNDKQLPASVMKKYGDLLCDMQEKGRTVQAIGFAAEEALTPGYTVEDKKKLIDQYIIEVVGHEVGHCMGLRHNFAASTQLTEQQLADPSTVTKYGIGASIMDYNPFNAAAVGRRDVDFYSQTIGTYDYWAIQYGYTPIKASSPNDEISTLHTIASLGSTPGHIYESDRSANGLDPYVVTFDSSRQPLDFLEKMVDMGPKIRAGAHKKIKNGESYYQFTRSFLAGMSAQVNNGLAATKFIGGGRLMTSFHGDPNEQPGYLPLDGTVQRRALNLVNKALFAPDAFDLSRTDLNHLTYNPKSPGMEVMATSRVFPIQQSITVAYRLGLGMMLSSDTLTRMSNNEYRVGPAGNTLTMAEMFHSLDKNIWSEVDNGKAVSPLRRELQRTFLDNLIPIALGQSRAPNDARDLAMDELVSLRHRIALDLPKAKDEYTGPHLRECMTRINRALNAQSTVPVGQ